MCKVRIDNLASDRIAITTPYNPKFVRQIKLAGGRWDDENRVWTMDAANIDLARKILRDIYGYDDITEADTKFVRVRITALREIHACCKPIILFGRVIASARGRDSGARTGEGVAFVERNPRIGDKPSAVSHSARANRVMPLRCVQSKRCRSVLYGHHCAAA